MCKYFVRKTVNIRKQLEKYNDLCRAVNDVLLTDAPVISSFSAFEDLNESDVKALISSLTLKTCSLDPTNFKVGTG